MLIHVPNYAKYSAIRTHVMSQKVLLQPKTGQNISNKPAQYKI